MKLIAAVFLFLSVAQPSQAGPRHWLKEHKRQVFDVLVLGGSSAIQVGGMSYCESGDFEKCNVGYGSRHAFAGFTIGAGAALLFASWRCRKDDGGRICDALAYGVPVYQTVVGLHDIAKYAPEKKSEESLTRKRGD